MTAAMVRWLLLALACLLAGPAASAADSGAKKKIVLIGGMASEAPGRHDYPGAIRFIKLLLESAAGPGWDVQAFPDGWPADPAALDGAASVLWYFDGLDRHPLLDTTRRAHFERLMARGAGLVALHQAFTVPAGETAIGLERWLGGARIGTFDRTTQSATLLAAPHPVGRGVGNFALRDEFYPTLRLADGITPILSGTLHAQFRDGASVTTDQPEERTVAWAFQRPDGGRAVAYSGAHFLAALDQPAIRRLLLNAVAWTAGDEVPAAGLPLPAAPAPAADFGRPPRAATDRVPALDTTTFHRDAERSGWHPQETVLTPARVASPSFGRIWETPPFDTVDGQAPRLYASPLYVDEVAITGGQHAGASFPVVFAATSNGYVYAVNAFKTGDLAAGRILWRRQLAAPCRLQPAPLDAVPTGVLSTPVIDAQRRRLYVTSCDPQQGWQAYALDLGSGDVLPGWPVRLDEARFNQLNRNAGPQLLPPTRRHDFRVQRGALNLSPDGGLLYVTFGETETGWLVSVDTARARLASAFAAAALPHRGSGGIWGAGGPAVDADGQVYVVTGSGFDGYVDRSHDWTQSVLKLSHEPDQGFVLRGSYTPFNHCSSARMDIDLGSGGVALLPRQPVSTLTPNLLVLGGKQGNVYLLDRDRLPGRLDSRPPCSSDPASDGSLLPPRPQPQFAHRRRGPLNVFGPYSEKDAALDLARARSVPAVFRDAHGQDHVFVTGNSKAGEGSADNVPPSLARLKVVRPPGGGAAYLQVDRLQRTLVFQNPGSPVVTSHGPEHAIVWVLDENAPRSAPLAGDGAPRPVLYAFEASTLKLLWRSAPGELLTSGKYNQPAFARGTVFVGTDRIQAFGLGPQLPARPYPTAQAGTEAGPAPPTARRLSLGAGQAIYAQRCAACHEQPQGNIPPRRIIASRSHAAIVRALTVGSMRAQASGLHPAEIDAIARAVRNIR